MEHRLFNGHTWGKGGGDLWYFIKSQNDNLYKSLHKNNMQNTYAVHLPYVIILKSARSG